MKDKSKTRTSERKDWKANPSNPNPEKPNHEGSVNVGLAIKSLRELPRSSYSLLSDPYTSMSAVSQPYAPYNVFNKHIGGNYKGDKNLDGGNVMQYNNSEASRMLYAFDVARLQIGINYRYLPIKNSSGTVGRALVNEMRKAISEAMSVLQSTTYTQMAIYNFAVETDLPLGSGVTTNIGTEQDPIYAYTSRTDVFYAMSIFYQTFWLDILNTLKWHNSFRLKQGVAVRNAWNREVPMLNAFFGLMNKKAFLSLIDSINLSFEGEYIDTDFASQAAMLNYAPSRRSNSYLDPVMEVQTRYNHPSTFKVYVLDNNGKAVSTTPLFSDTYLSSVFGEEVINIWDAIEELNDLLSLESTTYWARSYDYASNSGAGNTRYNRIKLLFDCLINAVNTFKPLWSDYREALDTLARTGIIKWVKGFRPATEQSTDAEMFDNLLVNDIYRMILGGAADVQFDNNTKRWRTFSLWNMYTGIPESDAKSGGAFLTLSFKNLDVGSDDDVNIEYLPLIFDRPTVGTNENVCVLVSRNGKEVVVTGQDVIASSEAFITRLFPLTSQQNLKIRIPTASSGNNAILAGQDAQVYASYLAKALNTMIGYSKVSFTSSGVTGDKSLESLDPDLIAIYQIEIEDITNMAIAYARANSPIRGTTSDSGQLGFFGLSKT